MVTTIKIRIRNWPNHCTARCRSRLHYTLIWLPKRKTVRRNLIFNSVTERGKPNCHRVTDGDGQPGFRHMGAGFQRINYVRTRRVVLIVLHSRSQREMRRVACANIDSYFATVRIRSFQFNIILNY